MYPKDSYIVLLAGCDGTNTWKGSIPINHCYQLYRDSWDDDGGNGGFIIHKDISGTTNGWSCRGRYNGYALKMRYATPEEVEEYKRMEMPFDVTTLQPKEPQYEIY